MGWGRKLALVAGVTVIGASGGAVAQQGQKVTGPIATYWISTATQTGFGMPGMGGGGRPNASAMMSAMMGGGQGGATKTMRLELGSSQVNAAPAADHLPPEGLGAGPDLPLVTPKVQPVQRVDDTPEAPREFQRPRGRMLIFWGCGQHAKPGQPVVIDFSQINPQSPQMPAGFAALMQGVRYTGGQGPAPGRDRTYGDWPNEKARTQVPSSGSLVGEHTIQGNYSPTIKFTLDEDQDFLGPLNLTTNAKNAGGWTDLGWNLVGNAQAYLATAMGGSQDQVVFWSSSEVQGIPFAPEYFSPGDISRLVASKTLMGPATRACQVPKEVMDAMPQGILQLVAYGGEANFVYPPRPQDPKVAWNKQWAVKVRYRSATGGLLGMAMPQMPQGRQAYGAPPPQPGQPQPQQPQRPPSAADILKKGILGGALPFPH